MTSSIILNRRSGEDRRHHYEHRFSNRRSSDRRRPNTDNYVLVMGQGGIDRFSVLVTGLTLALLALMILALSFG